MSKTLIIAEAGVNHNGSIAIAKKLIDVAVDAKVDYVKFQTFKTENIISKTAKKAAYQVANTGNEQESQFEMVKKLELDEEKHKIQIVVENKLYMNHTECFVFSFASVQF